MAIIFRDARARAYGRLYKDRPRRLDPMAIVPLPVAQGSEPLHRPVPGALWPWVKRLSWAELAVFAALLAVWLAPGMEHATFIFGLSHGLGFIALCLLIWAAVLRREAPYTLLAATLTPVGPLGSVVAIEWIERRSATS